MARNIPNEIICMHRVATKQPHEYYSAMKFHVSQMYEKYLKFCLDKYET